jgi:AcrR family transcriptional regulator
MRADAQRNRAKVLDAAEVIFAEQGLSVPIDEIARAAGVGAGTVYRHFPTKEALFEAVVINRIELLTETARQLLADESVPPGEAFFGLIQQLADEMGSKRDLSDALESAGVDVKAQLSIYSDQLQGMLKQLLARAQDSGDVRLDVSADELLALVVGTCKSNYGALDPGARRRMMAIVCDGLRTT